jgi:hypothetical protein
VARLESVREIVSISKELGVKSEENRKLRFGDNMKLDWKLKLNPCPFCGNTGIYAGVESAMTSVVRCTRCGCRTRAVFFDEEHPDFPLTYEGEGDEYFSRLYKRAAEIAALDWNQRDLIWEN